MSANAVLEHVDCPVCGPAPFQVWMNDGKPTRYLKCRQCGTVFASPRATSDLRFAWLSENYGIGDKVFAYTATRQSALFFESSVIKQFVQGGKLLDVGCDTGDFFQWFQSPTWERFGVELIPSAAEYAAKTRNAKVTVGTLRQAAFLGKFFDLVTLIDMFYYLEDPNADLVEANRILQSNGTLAIELTGQDYQLLRSRGVLSLLLDHRWTRLATDSAYLFWLNPRGLHRLLNENGFQVVDWRLIPFEGKNPLLKFGAKIYQNILAKLIARDYRVLTWVPRYLCLAKPIARKEILRRGESQPFQFYVRQGVDFDVPGVVALHVEHLSNHCPDQTEIDFIAAYYRHLLQRTDDALYVLAGSNTVIGFASVVKNQSWVLVDLALSHPLLFSKLIRRLIVSPKLFGRVVAKLKSEFAGAKWQGNDMSRKPCHELRSIVIDSAYQDSGLGTLLLQTTLEHARQKRWTPMAAWVHQDNGASNRLFQKLGFAKINAPTHPASQTHLYLWQAC